jgi:hypothetical protein
VTSTEAEADSDAVRDNDMTVVAVLAAAAALAVLVANVSGIAVGDDGVGYRAIADSLLAGEGYGYFLEDPVTVWPPVWPALMALVARITLLDTLGAAIVLNSAVAAAVVIVGNRLLRQLVGDARLVLAGTVVLALGPATIGLGHVLMTDMAFALVTMLWMLTLIRFHRDGSLGVLVGAALWCWVGFGLRYVGLVLIAFGGLWLLVDRRRSLAIRARNGMIYGVVAVIVPLVWMLRNRSIDGTFTGERNPSARGLVDNGFDVAATLGRFLLPGVGNGLTRIWAAIGLVALGVALWLAWRVLAADRTPREALDHLWSLAGRPLGLVAGFAVLYLGYMLYVRTTTALNQLDTRLLFPAYFPLVFTALALLERVPRGVLVARVWMGANVAAGLIGMVAFALGHPYFAGNYESDVFQQARNDVAVAGLPDGCQLYSNLPNALYPDHEADWSPQRRALESSRELDDLEQITATLEDPDTLSCLIWIDEPPVYGHLWTLEDLRDRLDLVEIGSEGSVTTFVMLP